jgi:uncharacterized ion transporter superfamily protein YfcC
MEETLQLFDLQIDPASQEALNDGAKWAKFLAIAGFCGCGLFVLLAVIAGYKSTGIAAGADGIGYGVGVALVYVVFGALYFFPCLFLYNYSRKIKEAIASSDQEVMGKGFSQLKLLFKYMGILTIIGIAGFVMLFLYMLLKSGH